MEENVVEKIFNNMMACISSGEWVPGCKLPTENELASRFHASRSSVRQAIARLKALDMIEAKRGSGTVLKKYNASAALNDFIPTIMFEIEDNLQIFEFHKGIQIECIKLAAGRYTAEQMDKLIYHSQQMGVCYMQDDAEGAIRHDLEFHKVICEMSNNIMFVRATERIYEHLAQSFLRICTTFDYTASMVLHERMIEALKSRDAVFAASLMEAHQLDTYHKHLQIIQRPISPEVK